MPGRFPELVEQRIRNSRVTLDPSTGYLLNTTKSSGKHRDKCFMGKYFSFNHCLGLGIIVFALGTAGCHQGLDLQKNKYSEQRELMWTTATIDVCKNRQAVEEREAAYKDVWARLDEIAWKMNVFDEKSDVTKVNQAYPQAAAVGQDTYYVIEQALRFNRLTNGAFDITVWPLMQLWKKAQTANQLPSEDEIHQVQEAVGGHQIRLLGGFYVQLLHPATRLDLGGIAAGYAIDEAARIFRAQGIKDFFIDIGGDIYAGGKNCQGQDWRVGIRDPHDLAKIVDVVHLSDASVTTSGNYSKFMEIQGKRWSHIINPLTGYPQEDVISATFIAPTGIEGDALAKAPSVLGAEKGLAFVDSLGPGYAVFIISQSPDKKLRKFSSKEYKKFQVNP
ncbi:MAG: FAD:protein FMN transferase [Candidatus Omnitrophota bacterium]|nr:FAD:protein FMN transferase [Candidatus Omnitrophota bacterium]